ncbi:MAG: T9SS type A sorting domain-containing protein [Flavobacteriales bacterium]|nr:T9SS type A sorting domain-containing protein [Flavobacteriales bacterium]
MRNIFILLCAAFFTSILHSQTPTWSEDVAPIIFDNCSKCHHQGQIGPFELMSYDDAVENADDIAEAVSSGEMPPWPANPEYRHFAYEEILSSEEIQTIVDWVQGGTPSGDLDLAPPAPQFPDTGTQLEVIDFTVAMEPYTLQYNTDEWRWFAIENPYDDTVYVNAIEVIPGLPELVHHADISYDLSGYTNYYDNQDPLSGFNNDTGWPNYDYYMNAWMAGGNVVKYPENWGIEVLPNSYFVFEIHYGPGGQGQTDSTKMHLQFVQNPEDVRPVYPSWILNGPSENNGSLYIPANEISWFTQESGVIWSEYSIISICPHQHMTGDSYKVWLETMEGDSIPLIDIPEWDFHWQMYYTFLYPQHVPAGSKFKAIASYDNTVNNEDNPNDPPQDVWSGNQTTDEMMMTFVIWAPYEEGDEDLLMDSTYVVSANEILMENPLSIYPNPAINHIYISPPGVDARGSTVQFINLFGDVVMEEIFDGGVDRYDITGLSPGVYVIQINNGKMGWRGKLVKQ